MKKYLYSNFALLALVFYSCGGGDDAEESIPGDDKPQKKVEIKVSDDVVGVKQVVEFSINYETNNPNILVTWYADGEKQNSIPRSELSTTWKASSIGEHLIEVAITDREQVLKFQKTINVVETEFGDAIIGDSKSKIARTFGASEKDEVIVNRQSSVHTYSYYFTSNKLTEIQYEYALSLTPRNKTDYMVPVLTFNTAYRTHKEKYGDPIQKNFTDIETDESKIIEYGGHIYAGGMYFEAYFQNSTRGSRIYIGPYRSGFGFTYIETLEKR